MLNLSHEEQMLINTRKESSKEEPNNREPQILGRINKSKQKIQHKGENNYEEH